LISFGGRDNIFLTDIHIGNDRVWSSIGASNRRAEAFKNRDILLNYQPLPSPALPSSEVKPPKECIMTDTDNIDIKKAFAEEKLGWRGYVSLLAAPPLTYIWLRYVEWEKYPEKKELATRILNKSKFTPIPGTFLALNLGLCNSPLSNNRVPIRSSPRY